jgi:hypothetical protein
MSTDTPRCLNGPAGLGRSHAAPGVEPADFQFNRLGSETRRVQKHLRQHQRQHNEA